MAEVVGTGAGGVLVGNSLVGVGVIDGCGVTVGVSVGRAVDVAVTVGVGVGEGEGVTVGTLKFMWSSNSA